MAKKTEQIQPQTTAEDHRGHGGSYVTDPESSAVTLVDRGGQAPAAPKRRGFGEPDAAAQPDQSSQE